MPYPTADCSARCRSTWIRTALRAQGLSGNDVAAAFNAQNSILPAGTQKIGDREYFVTVNAKPEKRSPSSTTCRLPPATAA